MRKLLALFLLFAGVAHGQTTVYQCPTTTLAGRTAHLGTECPGWTWSAPDRNKLVASCGAATCSWNSSTTWRTISSVPATAAISVCTGTVNATTKKCSAEVWQRRDVQFPDSTTPTPVNCVMTPYALTPSGTHPWTPLQCGDGGTRSRVEVWTRSIQTPASNGGVCPEESFTAEVRNTTETCPAWAKITNMATNPTTLLVGDETLLSWTTSGATECAGSWSGAAGQAVNTNGSTPIRVTVPMESLWFDLKCKPGNVGSRVGVRVLSRGPDCWPNQIVQSERDKVRVTKLTWANSTMRYQAVAMFYCPNPDPTKPPIRNVWVFGIGTVAPYVVDWTKQIFDVNAAKARCDAICEMLPPGPMRTEVETWAAQFSAADIGVLIP